MYGQCNFYRELHSLSCRIWDERKHIVSLCLFKRTWRASGEEAGEYIRKRLFARLYHPHKTCSSLKGPLLTYNSVIGLT